MSDKIKAIQALEEKYGNVKFRMGLSHLADVGARNLTVECVKEGFKQIYRENEENKANDKIAFMTPEFQCGILQCSAELSKHSIWDLIRYVKEHMVI